MDKRIVANKVVKDKMLQALVELASLKDLSKISVLELIEKASVARSSFYRNFNSIEEIIDYGIEELAREYHSNKPKNEDVKSEKSILYKFEFYEKHSRLVLTFHHANSLHSLLDVITNCEIEEAGDMSFNAIERYELYYFSGAFYNVLCHWLEDGAKESAEQMTKEFIRIMNK